MSAADAPARIRVGIGGWSFDGWRGGAFYPPGLKADQELAYASRQLSTIEINSTFYSSQSPATFAKWRDQTPPGFVFSVKAPRLATQRKDLAETESSVRRFVEGGVLELGDKLGPMVWQFATHQRFDAQALGGWLERLPRRAGGRALRHALEVRHPSFMCAEYLMLARAAGVATVFTDSDDYPSFADATGDFIYVRTMRQRAELEHGHDAATLAAMGACARTWAEGGEPAGLPRVAARPDAPSGAPCAMAGAPRDVFVLFIAGAKERAPAAAQQLIALLAA